MEHVEHPMRALIGSRALLVNRAEELHEPARRHSIDDAGLEGAFVLDAPAQVDALDADARQHGARVFNANEIQKQVSREVAARRNHVPRQLVEPHRAADVPVNLRVRVACRGDAKRRPVGGAEEAIANGESG